MCPSLHLNPHHEDLRFRWRVPIAEYRSAHLCGRLDYPHIYPCVARIGDAHERVHSVPQQCAYVFGKRISVFFWEV
jgi:hypothetical protein